MHITVLRGESTDLLHCKEPDGKPFYIVVPTGSTDELRSAADWQAFFADGRWMENTPASMRSAQWPTHQPIAPRDGYVVALEHRRDKVTPISSSARFATGHTGSPDGYAIALSAGATVHSFPTANPDGYAAALANRKDS